MIPNHFNTKMAPEVHELTQTAFVIPVRLQISSSKALTLGPEVIQPELSESITSSITSLSTKGGENLIFCGLKI